MYHFIPNDKGQSPNAQGQFHDTRTKYILNLCLSILMKKIVP